MHKVFPNYLEQYTCIPLMHPLCICVRTSTDVLRPLHLTSLPLERGDGLVCVALVSYCIAVHVCFFGGGVIAGPL